MRLKCINGRPDLYRSGIILTFFRQKQSVSYGLSYGGWPVLYGHWQFACAYGNRARFYDDACVVEMYVSS